MLKFHTPPSFQSVGESGLPALKQIRKLAFDGSGDFLMADTSCFAKFQEDPYFVSDVFPDEQKFIDWDTAVWRVGWEEVYIEDGKVVNLPYEGHATTSGSK